MKNPWLWLGSFTFCIVLMGLGVVQQNEKAASAPASVTSGCDAPKSGASYTFKGTVIKVTSLADTNQFISTVGSGSCEISVIGSPWQLSHLMHTNSQVKFQTTYNNGFYGNPQGVVLDSTVITANQPSTPRQSLRIYMTEGPEWISQTEGVLTITRKNGSQESFTISKQLGSQIKIKDWNIFYYDDQFNIVGVN